MYLHFPRPRPRPPHLSIYQLLVSENMLAYQSMRDIVFILRPEYGGRSVDGLTTIESSNIGVSRERGSIKRRKISRARSVGRVMISLAAEKRCYWETAVGVRETFWILEAESNQKTRKGTEQPAAKGRRELRRRERSFGKQAIGAVGQSVSEYYRTPVRYERKQSRCGAVRKGCHFGFLLIY